MPSRFRAYRSLRRLLALQLAMINSIFIAVGFNWLEYRERALELFLATIAAQLVLIVRTYRHEGTRAGSTTTAPRK